MPAHRPDQRALTREPGVGATGDRGATQRVQQIVRHPLDIHGGSRRKLLPLSGIRFDHGPDHRAGRGRLDDRGDRGNRRLVADQELPAGSWRDTVDTGGKQVCHGVPGSGARGPAAAGSVRAVQHEVDVDLGRGRAVGAHGVGTHRGAEIIRHREVGAIPADHVAVDRRRQARNIGHRGQLVTRRNVHTGQRDPGRTWGDPGRGANPHQLRLH